MTGVQTCALPIWPAADAAQAAGSDDSAHARGRQLEPVIGCGQAARGRCRWAEQAEPQARRRRGAVRGCGAPGRGSRRSQLEKRRLAGPEPEAVGGARGEPGRSRGRGTPGRSSTSMLLLEHGRSGPEAGGALMRARGGAGGAGAEVADALAGLSSGRQQEARSDGVSSAQRRPWCRATGEGEPPAREPVRSRARGGLLRGPQAGDAQSVAQNTHCLGIIFE